MPNRKSDEPQLRSNLDLRETAASRTLLHLTDDFIRKMHAHTGPGPVPREMDETAFACLLLCLEHGFAVSAVAPAKIAECTMAVRKGTWRDWLDEMPWRLCHAALALDDQDPAVTNLIENLSHGNSGIRAYTMELAWFLRHRLPVHDTAPHLLRNVANTLGFVDMSAGLCFAICGSEDAFWSEAEEFAPPEGYGEQYVDRLQRIKDAGVAACTRYFWQMEAEIRRRIMGVALELD